MMATVDIERQDGVATLWLARPERKNALSPPLIEALHEALAKVADDPTVRCVVLAGRGGTFCAGGDLGGGMLPEGGMVEAERLRGRYGALLLALRQLSVPVIAAVEGVAMGGGLGLVAACDLAVASVGARLGTPELKVGLFPYVISAFLRRDVPRKALAALIYDAEPVSAEVALSLGLINRVVPEGEAVVAAQAWAASVARHSRAALSLGKRAMAETEDRDLAAAVAHLNGRLTLGLLTEDAAEGVAAFFGKRPPAWNHR
jgi:enoyl-CoA hydratase/carnithine racemase